MSETRAFKLRAFAAAATAVALAACCLAGCGQGAASGGAGGTSAAGSTGSSNQESQNAGGGSSAAAGSAASFITTASKGGTVTFDASGVAEDAVFVNYAAAGNTVQLLAIRDAGGELHVALNTCQSCNPSPKAYFVQEGEALVCQNCLNSFTAEDVGSAANGCNPAPVQTLAIKGDTVSISASELDSYAPAFAQWAGPVG